MDSQEPLTSYKFLAFAFDTINKCYPSLSIDGQGPIKVNDLIMVALEKSLVLPLGIVAWSAKKQEQSSILRYFFNPGSSTSPAHHLTSNPEEPACTAT